MKVSKEVSKGISKIFSAKHIESSTIDEHADDVPVGKVLSRREILGLFAGAGTTIFLAGCVPLQSVINASSSDASSATATATPGATTTGSTTSATTAAASPTTAATTTAATGSGTVLPTCVVVPELTEGPYFVDEKINRSDIRTDTDTGTVQEGVPLRLVFNVSSVSSGSCAAFQGAYVDIWHCNAAGLYSDEQQNNTVGQNFLRGYQVTDANGKAEFTTIYPGWYSGRTVHIHFKIRNALGATTSPTFTSQLFFDDTLTDTVFINAPYASKGTRNVRNANDSIYKSGGSTLLLNLTKEGDGYTATFNIGVSIA
jgi:protocatechuate 3,4-dioxygenase beta subunit